MSHLSEAKHNNITKFTILTELCLSKLGAKYKNKDHGGNIVFIKRELDKYLRGIWYIE